MSIVRGKIVKSDGVGRKLGFPTLNLSYEGEERGVFVGEVGVFGGVFAAAVNLGGRPTVDDKVFCEAHLLDFDGVIEEGTEVEVKLLYRIRDIQKFESLEELKMQIGRDVEFAKNWYNSRE